MTSASNKSGASLYLKVKGGQGLPSTTTASQEVYFRTLQPQRGLQQSQNTMGGPAKTGKEAHYAGMGESVTVTNRFQHSVGTGSASTYEKKECASHNLFNFADSGYNSIDPPNSSNPQAMVLWATVSGKEGRPNAEGRNKASDASSDNIVGTLRRLQTENSQGRAAKRYASVDREEFESDVSLSSYLSEANLNN